METTTAQPHSSGTFEGHLTLGNILEAAGVDPRQVLLLRHTYTKTGLTGPDDLTPAKIMAYVREQGVNNSKFPETPPLIWLNFIAVGGNRCRFLNAYENKGEAPAERTETRRFYDLVPSSCLATFQNRLVINWSNDPVNW